MLVFGDIPFGIGVRINHAVLQEFPAKRKYIYDQRRDRSDNNVGVSIVVLTFNTRHARVLGHRNPRILRMYVSTAPEASVSQRLSTRAGWVLPRILGRLPPAGQQAPEARPQELLFGRPDA